MLLTRPCANEGNVNGATVSRRASQKGKRKRRPDVWEFSGENAGQVASGVSELSPSAM